MLYNYLPQALVHALSCPMAWYKLTNNKERFSRGEKDHVSK